MKIDTSDYYPWDPSRKRPAENSENPANPANPAESAASIAENPASSASPESPESAASIAESRAGSPEEYEAPAGALTLISHILSRVLSPVLLPTLGIIVIFSLSMLSYAPMRAKLLIIAIVFSLTCVIPCAAIFVLTKFGDVRDMALTRRTDRLYPYLITGACLLACGYYLTRTGLPDRVGYFYIGAALATGINLLINFRWKISAHGAGIGGVIAMLLVLDRYGLPSCSLWGWVLAAIIAGGLLCAARVWLWRHTPLQTICGEAVGFLSVMLAETLL